MTNSKIKNKTKNKNRTRRVLIVEDDAASVDLLIAAVSQVIPDAEVRWAQSLEQACKNIIFNTTIEGYLPFELVIADVFLKTSGTGLDLQQIVRATTPAMPFLTISSLSEENVVSMLGEKEKNNLLFLKKPFSIKECVIKIKSVLADVDGFTHKKNYSKITALTKHSLLQEADRHRFYAQYINLQISVDWLEKQYWVDEFYGGYNQVQDLIFHARLIINRLWQALFAKRKCSINFDKKQIHECILQMGGLAPELNRFIMGRTRAMQAVFDR